jgi:hypothetical protein
MNNIEEFYNSKKLLKLVESRSRRNDSFFYRVYYDERSIKIELEDNFIKDIKKNEEVDIKYIIQEWINKKREEIEDHLINKLKTRLEENREQVRKDFEWKDKEVNLE